MDFVVYLVKSRPERIDVNDDADRTLWKQAIPYADMRHANITERHWAVCIRDALEIMRSRLVFSSAKLDEVHIYAHSTAVGEFWCRLRSGDEEYRYVQPDELRAFLSSELRSGLIAERGTGSTTVDVHGCHIGRSPEALTMLRSIFGAPQGFASGPLLFQNFLIGPVTLPKYRLRDGRVIHDGSPDTSENYVSLSGARQVSAYIDIVAKQAFKMSDEKHRAAVESNVRRTYNVLIERYLYDAFRRCLRGHELPWPDASRFSRAEAVQHMREIFERGAIPGTFLSRLPVDEAWVRSRLRNWPSWQSVFSREVLRRIPEVGAVWPDETSRWDSNHLYIPYKPAHRQILDRLP